MTDGASDCEALCPAGDCSCFCGDPNGCSFDPPGLDCGQVGRCSCGAAPDQNGLARRGGIRVTCAVSVRPNPEPSTGPMTCIAAPGVDDDCRRAGLPPYANYCTGGPYSPDLCNPLPAVNAGTACDSTARYFCCVP